MVTLFFVIMVVQTENVTLHYYMLGKTMECLYRTNFDQNNKKRAV